MARAAISVMHSKLPIQLVNLSLLYSRLTVKIAGQKSIQKHIHDTNDNLHDQYKYDNLESCFLQSLSKEKIQKKYFMVDYTQEPPFTDQDQLDFQDRFLLGKLLAESKPATLIEDEATLDYFAQSLDIPLYVTSLGGFDELLKRLPSDLPKTSASLNDYLSAAKNSIMGMPPRLKRY